VYKGLPQVMCAQLRMWCLTFLDKCTKRLSELGALLLSLVCLDLAPS